MERRGGKVIIGDYVALEWLMDNVHSGKNAKTSEMVSIKLIEKEGFNIHKRKQLLTEIAVLNNLYPLRPQSFPRLIEAIETEQRICVISEPLGSNLLSFIATNGRIVEREVRLLFAQICSALQVCHSNGITHHGMNLDKLWVSVDEQTQDLKAKLSGFDHCCLQKEVGELLSNFEDCQNQYAPPEVFKGQRYDGRALDLYGLGVVLYALLVGDLPFTDDDCDLQIEQKSSKNFLSSLRFPADISLSAKELVWGLLRPNPKKRIALDQVLVHPFFDIKNSNEQVTEPKHDGRGEKEEDMMVQVEEGEEERLLRLFERDSGTDSKDVVMTEEDVCWF